MGDRGCTDREDDLENMMDIIEIMERNRTGNHREVMNALSVSMKRLATLSLGACNQISSVVAITVPCFPAALAAVR